MTRSFLLSVAVTLVAAFSVSAHSVLQQTHECTGEAHVATGTACAKPLTGCICIGDGSGTINPLPNCGGCHIVVMGTVECSNTVTPFNCDTNLGCGSRSSCGTTCPCTGGDWLPIIESCTTCHDV